LYRTSTRLGVEIEEADVNLNARLRASSYNLSRCWRLRRHNSQSHSKNRAINIAGRIEGSDLDPEHLTETADLVNISGDSSLAHRGLVANTDIIVDVSLHKLPIARAIIDKDSIGLNVTSAIIRWLIPSDLDLSLGVRDPMRLLP